MMATDVEPIPVDMPDSEVARLFERKDWVSAPVVDREVDCWAGSPSMTWWMSSREDADHSFMSMAGLDEDEGHLCPGISLCPRRAVWLGINLLTAFIASGSSTCSGIRSRRWSRWRCSCHRRIHGRHSRHPDPHCTGARHRAGTRWPQQPDAWLINREVMIGILNGALWALVVAVASSLWFDDWNIGLIIAAAMVINLITAAFIGAVLPLIMIRLDIDPALAGSVVLTGGHRRRRLCVLPRPGDTVLCLISKTNRWQRWSGTVPARAP